MRMLLQYHQVTIIRSCFESLPFLLLLPLLSRDSGVVKHKPEFSTTTTHCHRTETFPCHRREIPALAHVHGSRAAVRYSHFLTNTEGVPIDRAATSNAHARIRMKTRIDQRRRPERTVASPADLAEVLDDWSQYQLFCGTAVVRWRRGCFVVRSKDWSGCSFICLWGGGCVRLFWTSISVGTRSHSCLLSCLFLVEQHAGRAERNQSDVDIQWTT
jgi:hypothetical protein